MTESHIMRRTMAGDTEEWTCPTCGRRFLLSWPPDYRKVVLDVGDATIAHTGSIGALGVTLSVCGAPYTDDGPALLAPWRSFLEEL